ncbi:hypothetical protein DRN02_018285 [Sphingomonas paucimobilis]|uniref:hypothetical protein n=1 Tax=Sphingomonas TaxID=13687 RepID=UPI000DE23027|nr:MULTISPECIES: hypothetical protein [Sphingomonas]MBQ1478560.1 hypothetical protein [Sphingomonas sp.]QBE93721.1 hypothetical protein DRN02_018285 [Sphingomonas paucimobilis]
MSTNVRKTLVIASMGAALASPAMAQQQTAAPATTTPIAAPAAPDPAAVQRVVEAINAAIAAQPATATAQDIEAAVMFAVSQQQQPAAVSLAALTFVANQPGNAARKVKVALTNARSAVRRGQTGTGGTGGSAGNAASLAAGPSVGGGGVGVNYTTQN